MDLSRERLCAVIVRVAIAGSLVCGHASGAYMAAIPANQGVGVALQPSPLPQTAEAKGPSFEVASVRLSAPNGGGTPYISPAGTATFTATRISLQLLVGIAYGVPANHIHGAPGWFESQLYDVKAKAAGDGAVTARERQVLLQQLLKDRFHLAVRRETNDFQGYALVVTKKGASLEASNGPAQGSILRDRLQFLGGSLEDFARILEHVVGRPVADKTGIAGKYDIKLEYAPIDATDSSLPSIFTVLEEQLGLKLVPQKVPVEELVIDHVDRVPTEN